MSRYEITEDPRGVLRAVLPRRHDAIKTAMYIKIWKTLVNTTELVKCRTICKKAVCFVITCFIEFWILRILNQPNLTTFDAGSNGEERLRGGSVRLLQQITTSIASSSPTPTLVRDGHININAGGFSPHFWVSPPRKGVVPSMMRRREALI